ncbi:MAG: hypothetical protein ABI822_14805 [Bryobacteraceae bacterium]
MYAENAIISHPRPDDLEAYTMGSLTEAQTGALDEHLLVCGDCRALCLEMEQENERIREAFRPAPAKFAGKMPDALVAVQRQCRVRATRIATENVRRDCIDPLEVRQDLKTLPQAS